MFCNVFGAENKIGSFAFADVRSVCATSASLFISARIFLTFISTMKLLPKTITAHDKHFFSFCFPSVNNGLNRLAIIGI